MVFGLKLTAGSTRDTKLGIGMIYLVMQYCVPSAPTLSLAVAHNSIRTFGRIKPDNTIHHETGNAKFVWHKDDSYVTLLEFCGLAVPPGATVTKARIVFQEAANAGGYVTQDIKISVNDTALNWAGPAVWPPATVFATAANQWDTTGVAHLADEYYESPDIADALQQRIR